MIRIDALTARGIVHQSTSLDSIAALSPGDAVYCGFDPTAASLHVGHLITIRTMRRLAELGLRPILLVGGATARVGDPSFRSAARQAMDEATVQSNAKAIKEQIAFLMRGVEHEVVDNAEWLSETRHLDFMAEVGSRFTIARMLAFESVKSRLDDGLTFFELGYMLLQAFDFVHLNRSRGCVLQIGGSDQWANMVNGIDLARRLVGAELNAMTVPLLVDGQGRKMGKTAGGAAWIDAVRLHPRDFWQFWRNVDDAVVPTLLRLLTDVPLGRIDSLSSDPNAAKELLADAMTSWVHGIDRRPEADAFVVGEDRRLVSVLVRSGLASGSNAARRLIEQGGVRIDGEKVLDVDALVPDDAESIVAGRKREVRLSPMAAVDVLAMGRP